MFFLSVKVFSVWSLTQPGWRSHSYWQAAYMEKRESATGAGVVFSGLLLKLDVQGWATQLSSRVSVKVLEGSCEDFISS